MPAISCPYCGQEAELADTCASCGESWVFDYRYRLVQRVGDGPSGPVYRAQERNAFGDDGRVVAVVFGPEDDAEAGAAFAAGFRAAARLRDHNIIEVLSVSGSGAKRAFAVTEVLEGPTLLERVEQGGPLDEAGLRTLIQGLASGLKRAHGNLPSVVVRTISPALIGFRTACDHEPVLMGLGSAVQFGPGYGSPAPVHGGVDPAFAAPEAVQGGATPQADIYGVGAVGLYAATGKMPVDARLALPSSMDQGLASLLLRLSDRQASNRPQNATAVLSAVAGLSAASGSAATPTAGQALTPGWGAPTAPSQPPSAVASPSTPAAAGAATATNQISQYTNRPVLNPFADLPDTGGPDGTGPDAGVHRQPVFAAAAPGSAVGMQPPPAGQPHAMVPADPNRAVATPPVGGGAGHQVQGQTPPVDAFGSPFGPSAPPSHGHAGQGPAGFGPPPPQPHGGQVGGYGPPPQGAMFRPAPVKKTNTGAIAAAAAVVTFMGIVGVVVAVQEANEVDDFYYADPLPMDDLQYEYNDPEIEELMRQLESMQGLGDPTYDEFLDEPAYEPPVYEPPPEPELMAETLMGTVNKAKGKPPFAITKGSTCLVDVYDPMSDNDFNCRVHVYCGADEEVIYGDGDTGYNSCLVEEGDAGKHAIWAHDTRDDNGDPIVEFDRKKNLVVVEDHSGDADYRVEIKLAELPRPMELGSTAEEIDRVLALPKKLGSKQVKSVLDEAQDGFDYCANDYEMKGKVRVRMTIGGRYGDVTEAKVEGEYEGTDGAICIEGEVESLVFPEFREQSMSALFPVKLK